TSRIMDISEDVLVNTLAQILRKDQYDSAKKTFEENRNLEAIKREESQIEKVDFLNALERNIIISLLFFSNKELEFKVLDVHRNDEDKFRWYKPLIIRQKYKVFEKIYLDLQQDEIEFSGESFRKIYTTLIEHINQYQYFDRDKYIASIPQELASAISDLYLSEEKYILSNWERKSIIPKYKDNDEIIHEYVNQTLLNLRSLLLSNLIEHSSHQLKNI